jgi:glycosyltransferase involved in cell wall biosynthesis
MKMPKVSVVIPALNSASTLAACLDSILAQDYADFEICVVDGKSTDGTLEILEGYRCRCDQLRITSERDAGPYDAMNKGVAMARGDWVYFLGSDDRLYSPDVLGKVFAGPIPARVGLIYGNVKITGAAVFAKHGDVYDGRFTVDKLLDRNICHQAVFYRLKVLRELGRYNIRYPVFADWDMNLRFFARTRAVYRDLIVASFSGGGLSSREHIQDPFFQDMPQLRRKYFWWHLLFRKIRRRVESVVRSRKQAAKSRCKAKRNRKD